MIEEIREEWKDIQGFEGRYKISNKGRNYDKENANE